MSNEHWVCLIALGSQPIAQSFLKYENCNQIFNNTLRGKLDLRCHHDFRGRNYKSCRQSDDVHNIRFILYVAAADLCGGVADNYVQKDTRPCVST